MSPSVTATLAGLFLLLTATFGWLGARPARPRAPPRLIPWRFLMLLAFTGMIAMLVHLANMLRDPTGLAS